MKSYSLFILFLLSVSCSNYLETTIKDTTYNQNKSPLIRCLDSDNNFSKLSINKKKDSIFFYYKNFVEIYTGDSIIIQGQISIQEEDTLRNEWWYYYKYNKLYKIEQYDIGELHKVAVRVKKNKFRYKKIIISTPSF